ncbi:hypothetical protein HMPREF9136_0673 [Prevotella dentalis DSM 3688]|uniref:Uncharacterized protein n=1 Tax=Prevotella dentalis (strain ATCC 49559 / DSM 3688 / JCM 13448 / NCTC 12043 / ES 2772) TaxID=908937 RepID=F9D1E5_PREDD|nr:hypothetical protein HMPREF9136_0673 [Prevotella dentalis DSM 3688]
MRLPSVQTELLNGCFIYHKLQFSCKGTDFIYNRNGLSAEK